MVALKSVKCLERKDQIKMKAFIAVMVVMFGLVVLSARAEEAAGQATFDAKCAMCHGKDGKGKTKIGEKNGIKDMTDAKVQEGYTDEKAIKVLKEGLKDGDKVLMKAYDLTDAELKAVMAYVRTFAKK